VIYYIIVVVLVFHFFLFLFLHVEKVKVRIGSTGKKISWKLKPACSFATETTTKATKTATTTTMTTGTFKDLNGCVGGVAWDQTGHQ